MGSQLLARKSYEQRDGLIGKQDKTKAVLDWSRSLAAATSTELASLVGVPSHQGWPSFGEELRCNFDTCFEEPSQGQCKYYGDH